MFQGKVDEGAVFTPGQVKKYLKGVLTATTPLGTPFSTLKKRAVIAVFQ
jgi:hypothetical protein